MLTLNTQAYNIIFQYLLSYAFPAALLLCSIQYCILFKLISFGLFTGIAPGLPAPYLPLRAKPPSPINPQKSRHPV